ncbi:MAG: metal ABC transporter permease [Cyanobacteriota bacterium]|nr:metal ABC transporter permease [Cyanobacteriota bacterium]
MEASLVHLLDLVSYPFMQRALLGGLLLGLLGGWLGSFAILRQLSFFSHTVGHAALLGIVLGIVLNLEPTLTLLPFTVLFGLGVIYLIGQTNLWSETVLNIVFSASLAMAVLTLSLLPGYRGNLMNLLFGDILAIGWRDVGLIGLVLVAALLGMGLTLRSQMILTLHPDLAHTRGVAVDSHRLGFVVLLSLAVAVAIKAVGVLLVNAFLVIPAATAKLLSQEFHRFLLLATGLGSLSALLGMLLSAVANLAAGPSIVVAQFALFVMAMLWFRLRRRA